MTVRGSDGAKELQFELKYCERCGGLWLRPAGGGQIYCVGCGREVAELPPTLKEAEAGNAAPGRGWGERAENVPNYEGKEGVGVDAAAGVA